MPVNPKKRQPKSIKTLALLDPKYMILKPLLRNTTLACGLSRAGKMAKKPFRMCASSEMRS
jgi:hypothetical protein